MVRFLLFCFLFLSIASKAQFSYVFNQNIPVKDQQGNSLPIPWAGGLNAAQYNTMDLNNDGKEDLVLFDRMANKVITFLNQNNQYQYAPEFELLFPQLTNWLLLRDFNCDGKKDIFTGDVLGIRVFINETPGRGNLAWKQFLFYTGFSGPKSSVLLTLGFTSKINLQMQYDDLPSIIDADGDGDLDIFNVRFSGNGTVEFHKNFSKERYNTCDSLDFERQTQTWGNFKECQCGEFAFNNEECGSHSNGRTQHAGGKSLLVMDVNGDQSLDILLSEATCDRLYLLSNQGTLENPVITSSTTFPGDHPVNFQLFPAAFYEDIDFDGVKDLISSPNIYAKPQALTLLNQSNWFYKNTGTTSNPNLTYVKNNFLQDQMIDVGDNAIPAFVDYDGDSDYDMFISRSSSPNYSSTIYFFENVGTPATPEFKLVTDDYSRFSQSLYYNLKIQFTDLDNDNTIDLVFTATDFSSGATELYYVSNKSKIVLDFAGQSIKKLDFKLTYNENVHVTDVDADGLADILLGKSNGSLQFWKNSGASGAPTFTLEKDNYLGFASSVLRQYVTCTSADLDADGFPDLVLGDQSGILKIIGDFRNQSENPDQASAIIFNNRLDGYFHHNLGGVIWPTVVNLTNSDKPDIAVGNILGGVHILSNDEGLALPDNPVIDIFPNPANRNRGINIKVDRPIFVQVISVLGRKLDDPIRLQANEIYNYNLNNLSAGIYLLKFTIKDKYYTRRIVIY